MNVKHYLPEKLVDLSKLETATGGNSDFMSKMIQLFIDDTPPQVESMKTALEKNDHDTVRNIAHKLKPSIEMVSCPELGALVRQVEAKEGNNLESDTDLLIESIHLLINQLK